MSTRLPSDEVAEDYKSSLEDLIDVSRLVINNLTVIAKENIEHAMTISRVLENHIKIAPPSRKLPALYLLDSIVKNVGTPYTLFLSRNLYSTFMNAYTLVTAQIRQKLDEMLQTWKSPNPGSLDTKPVFPPEVTRPIEEALRRARSAALEQQQQQNLRAHMDSLNRGQIISPVNVNRYAVPSPAQPYGSFVAGTQSQYQTQPYQQVPSQPGQYIQNSAPFSHTTSYLPPTAPQPQAPYTAHVQVSPSSETVNLLQLHRDIEELIKDCHTDIVSSPYDLSIRGRLDALLALQTILQQQYHPPEQLQQVQAQVMQLRRSQRPTHAGHVQGSFGSQPVQPPNQISFGQTQTPEPPKAVDLQALLSSTSLAGIIAQAQQHSVVRPDIPAVHSSIVAPVNGVSDLLLSLQKSGILSDGASKSKLTAHNPPPANSLPSHKSFLNEVPLDSASLKIPRPHLIALLYEQQPNQCATCGRRFSATEAGRERKRQHYDWHFQTNKRMNESTNRAQNRSWYVDELDWIKSQDDPETGLEGGDGQGTTGTIKGEQDGASAHTAALQRQFVLVPSDPALANQPCPICQEKFVASYSDEVSDWVWMDAVKVGPRIYHATCRVEMKKNASRDSTPARTATPDSVLGKRKAIADGTLPVVSKSLKV